jgi:diketogulonate reductase-like aldo/keto reductase
MRAASPTGLGTSASGASGPDHRGIDSIGHEFIGVVEHLGPDVQGLAQGDLVIAPFISSDMSCPHGQNGSTTSCPSGRNFGNGTIDGGPDRTWYVRAVVSGSGRARAGGVERDVTISDARPRAHEAIDAAYHAKYDRYRPATVGSVVGPDAHRVTIRLTPEDLDALGQAAAAIEIAGDRTNHHHPAEDDRSLIPGARMTSTQPHITLNNGVEMPALGLGVFQTPPDETRDAVRAALHSGYRLIDSAASYGNEREVGEAVRTAGVDRSEVFLETKIWISDYGYDETLHGFDKSSRKLGVDQIDLLLLHQPLPSAFDRTREAYRALETLLAEGKVRAIGVSNFMVEHLTELLDRATVVPAVNQIEVHPYFAQRAVQAFGAEHGILTQAWSPIGGITFYRDGQHTSTLDDAVIGGIAKAHGKTAAQVMLRWGLQQGRSVIPKSTKAHRIAENIAVFDFELSAEQMAAIDGLDTGRRGGPDPATVTLEAFGREIGEA